MHPVVASIPTLMLHADESLDLWSVLEAEGILLLFLAMGVCQAAGTFRFLQVVMDRAPASKAKRHKDLKTCWGWTTWWTTDLPKSSKARRPRHASKRVNGLPIDGEQQRRSRRSAHGEATRACTQDAQSTVSAALEAIGRVVDEQAESKAHARDAVLMRSLLPTLERLNSNASDMSLASTCSED
ncbi:hypothetical protein T484DRAFT_1929146 [Baffinella frigidus]|nr:hypothetical protein T484DRAFT_1929146 [Cryptophyta sp. CCMP2293]|mmetsp:Transcript_15220/g.35408  ORF Transcript_15220/g.35408 Transcript_15220/m.35408 type:complete len:184 (+) Transcript_15220:30-581(+)